MSTEAIHNDRLPSGLTVPMQSEVESARIQCIHTMHIGLNVTVPVFGREPLGHSLEADEHRTLRLDRRDTLPTHTKHHEQRREWMNEESDGRLQPAKEEQTGTTNPLRV